MRNLKRILSLAMASIMLVGMMAISASAVDFPDSDKIEHTDAVNTMVALGIIKGNEDGTFDPERVVTRAEMAKMICVALNGGKDPNLSGAGLYPDTKGHWAAGYIDYCSNLGIVAGDEKGNFNPNATITGVEAAKMILIAIGYNAENEKYVKDDNWATNIGVDASTKDLYKDVAIVPTEGLTRDNAAQMLWNGMQATMVEYDYKVGAVDGNVTSIAIAKDRDGHTILTDKFSMDTDIIILTSVKKDNKDTYTLKGTAVDAAKTTFTKVENDVSSLLGQEVKILYKENKPDSVYGVYATNNNDVVETYQKDISKDGAKVKIDGTSYELESCTFITDGEVGTGANSTNLVDEVSFNSVKLIDNDGDDKYEYAVVTTVTPVKVTYVSSSEIIAGGTSYKFADHNVEDGLKKGDYATVTYSIGGDNYDVAKLESLEGKISGYKTGTNDQYKIDGDWYTVAGTKVAGINGAGKTITFCAVNGVIVKDTVKVADSTTLDNVVMVLKADPASATTQNARVIHTDGTKATVAVDADGETTLTPGALYTYTSSDEGYEFKAAAKVGDYTWTAGAANDVKAVSSKVSTVSGKSIADDAKIFVYLSNDAKVITGKQLKKLDVHASNENTVIANSQGSFYGEVGGMDRIVLAAVTTGYTALPSVGDDAKNYALIVETAYAEDEDYITYKIWDGSDVVTVREKKIGALSARVQMAVVKYSSVDSDSVIKDVDAVTPTKGAVMGLLGDEVSFDGSKMLNLTDDTVYLYYDSAAEDAEDIGMAGAGRDIVVLADKIEGVCVENVKYVDDGTDVLFILVDTKNKLADATTKAITLTPGAPTNATAEFKDSDGNVLTGAQALKAGDLVTLTITATGDAAVKVTYDNANTKRLGDEYTSASVINLVAGGTWTRTFVVTGAADSSIAVADHA